MKTPNKEIQAEEREGGHRSGLLAGNFPKHTELRLHYVNTEHRSPVILACTACHAVYQTVYIMCTTYRCTSALQWHKLAEKRKPVLPLSKWWDGHQKIKLGPNRPRDQMGFKLSEQLNGKPTADRIWVESNRSSNQHVWGQTIKMGRNEQFGTFWTHRSTIKRSSKWDFKLTARLNKQTEWSRSVPPSPEGVQRHRRR